MKDYLKSEHQYLTCDNRSQADLLFASMKAHDLPCMADVDSSLLFFCREVSKQHKVVLTGECADEVFGGYPWYHRTQILFEETFPWSRTTDVRRSILRNGFLPEGEEYAHNAYLETVKLADSLDTDTPLERRMREMFVLNLNWFMQTLLVRKDVMSMESSLEVRVPFCDYRIVEYAYNMPWNIKSYNNREKGILRKACLLYTSPSPRDCS